VTTPALGCLSGLDRSRVRVRALKSRPPNGPAPLGRSLYRGCADPPGRPAGFPIVADRTQAAQPAPVGLGRWEKSPSPNGFGASAAPAAPRRASLEQRGDLPVALALGAKAGELLPSCESQHERKTAAPHGSRPPCLREATVLSVVRILRVAHARLFIAEAFTSAWQALACQRSKVGGYICPPASSRCVCRSRFNPTVRFASVGPVPVVAPAAHGVPRDFGPSLPVRGRSIPEKDG
jgi:hypothetical protein